MCSTVTGKFPCISHLHDAANNPTIDEIIRDFVVYKTDVEYARSASPAPLLSTKFLTNGSSAI